MEEKINTYHVGLTLDDIDYIIETIIVSILDRQTGVGDVIGLLYNLDRARISLMNDARKARENAKTNR